MKKIELEHILSVMIWNEFIAKTINKGCNFSFNNLEKRIKEIIDAEINTNNTTKKEIKFCDFIGHNSDLMAGGKCRKCGSVNCTHEETENLYCDVGWLIEGKRCKKCKKML